MKWSSRALGSLLTLPLAAALCSCGTTNQASCDVVFFVKRNCEEPSKQENAAPAKAPAPTAVPKPEPTVLTAAHPEPKPAPAPEPPPPPPVAAEPAAAAPDVPVVNAVYFEIGKDQITPAARLTLGKIAEFLKASKGESIKLAASTDPLGKVAKNQALAESRSKQVLDYLSKQGVERDRIAVITPTIFKDSSLPQAEYWRLRKVVVLYGADVMSKVQQQEAEEDRKAENDIPVEPPANAHHPRPKTTKAAKPSEEPNGDKKLETIDVLYWRSVNHSLFILAKRLGYFEDEGFRVRLHESQLEANELNVKLADKVGLIKNVAEANDVKKRHYFLGAVCPYGFHEAISKKLPFVEIGSMLTIPTTMIMKEELAAKLRKDIRNFRGTIGTLANQPADIDYTYLFIDAIKQAGLKEGSDFTLKTYKSDKELGDALTRGEIETFVSFPPDDLEFTSRHPGTGIFPLATLNANMPCCRQVVTRENLRKDRAKYVRFERAVLRAQRYLVEHPNESMEILSKFLNIPVSSVRSFLQRRGFALSAVPNVQGAIAFANAMKRRIGPGKVGDVRESTDTSVFEEALTDLIKEEPANGVYASMLATYKRSK